MVGSQKQNAEQLWQLNRRLFGMEKSKSLKTEGDLLLLSFHPWIVNTQKIKSKFLNNVTSYLFIDTNCVEYQVELRRSLSFAVRQLF